MMIAPLPLPKPHQCLSQFDRLAYQFTAQHNRLVDALNAQEADHASLRTELDRLAARLASIEARGSTATAVNCNPPSAEALDPQAATEVPAAPQPATPPDGTPAQAAPIPSPVGPPAADTPALALCAAVARSGKLGGSLTASDVLAVAQAAGIAIPGIMAHQSETVRLRYLGAWLGTLFEAGPVTHLGGFTIRRHMATVKVEGQRARRGGYRFTIQRRDEP